MIARGVARGPPGSSCELTSEGGPVPGQGRVSAPPGMSVGTARGDQRPPREDLRRLRASCLC